MNRLCRFILEIFWAKILLRGKNSCKNHLFISHIHSRSKRETSNMSLQRGKNVNLPYVLLVFEF